MQIPNRKKSCIDHFLQGAAATLYSADSHADTEKEVCRADTELTRNLRTRPKINGRYRLAHGRIPAREEVRPETAILAKTSPQPA